jgi:hypothetical protein
MNEIDGSAASLRNALGLAAAATSAPTPTGAVTGDTLMAGRKQVSIPESREGGGVVPPESFQAMIQAWATLHGITCLDAYGQFDWMTDEAREALIVSTLHTPALAAGIPID